MKNNKSIYIVGIFMLITMVSIGYAILTGQLNINGTAKVKAASWDIYFKNIKIKEGSVTASVTPSISDKTTVNFEVDLEKPGDFYEFNVDVVNDGMIDAMIESISITPELTKNQQKYLSYSVTYDDGVAIEEKDILHAQKTRKLKVSVEYKKNIENNELLSSDETINIKATIKYVQADSTAKEPTSQEKNLDKTAPAIGNATKNVTKASKNTQVIVTFEASDENEIIDTLTANDITVKVGGKTVTPTTKVLTSNGINPITYTLTLNGLTENGALTLNINSAKISDEYGNSNASTIIITPGVTINNVISVASGNGTNVGDQIKIGNESFYVIKNDGTNITMLAKYNLNATEPYNASTTYKQNTDNTKSTVVFNSTAYWGDVEYGAYVYDNRASIKKYVDNYKSYLESLGANITEARLMNYEEAVGLGCAFSPGTTNSTCEFSISGGKAPAWVYSTSYWTGAATSSSYLWGISSGYFSKTSPYLKGKPFGVRPVIVIPANSI